MGAGPGADPALVRLLTRSAGAAGRQRGSWHYFQDAPWPRESQYGGRDALPPRPPHGLRRQHLRPVLAVHATASRVDTGLSRGGWRQVRGGGDWVLGSGQRKGARSEDEVWEAEIRVPGSEASGAGIWVSVLGLEVGPRLHGLGQAA